MDTSDMSQYISTIQQESDPIKKANLLKSLHEDYDITYNVIASELEMSPAYISNYLRLLRLPALVLDGYYTGTISLTHLFILARIKDQDRIISLYEEILTKGLSALDLEELVRNILFATVSKGDPIGTEVRKAIERKFKTIDSEVDVKVIQTRIKSKVVLEVKGNRLRTNEFLRKLSEE